MTREPIAMPSVRMVQITAMMKISGAKRLCSLRKIGERNGVMADRVARDQKRRLSL